MWGDGEHQSELHRYCIKITAGIHARVWLCQSESSVSLSASAGRFIFFPHVVIVAFSLQDGEWTQRYSSFLFKNTRHFISLIPVKGQEMSLEVAMNLKSRGCIRQRWVPSHFDYIVIHWNQCCGHSHRDAPSSKGIYHSLCYRVKNVSKQVSVAGDDRATDTELLAAICGVNTQQVQLRSRWAAQISIV